MITNFEVRNYKALRDVSVRLTPFHAVVGQNDAGKTSLLEAIHACCQASQGLPPAEWFPKPWVGKQILSQGDAVGYGQDTVAGVVLFDSEGEDPAARRTEIAASVGDSNGRPIAVGVAHPCIEAWLLCTAGPIKKGCKRDALNGKLPDDPESLPAPRKDRRRNPKAVLQRISGCDAVPCKAAIAAEIWDFAPLRQKCPQGFAPFADEIVSRVKPRLASPAPP